MRARAPESPGRRLGAHRIRDLRRGQAFESGVGLQRLAGGCGVSEPAKRLRSRIVGGGVARREFAGSLERLERGLPTPRRRQSPSDGEMRLGQSRVGGDR